LRAHAALAWLTAANSKYPGGLAATVAERAHTSAAAGWAHWPAHSSTAIKPVTRQPLTVALPVALRILCPMSYVVPRTDRPNPHHLPHRKLFVHALNVAEKATRLEGCCFDQLRRLQRLHIATAGTEASNAQLRDEDIDRFVGSLG
jgi:hypothetical protein